MINRKKWDNKFPRYPKVCIKAPHLNSPSCISDPPRLHSLSREKCRTALNRSMYAVDGIFHIGSTY